MSKVRLVSGEYDATTQLIVAEELKQGDIVMPEEGVTPASSTQIVEPMTVLKIERLNTFEVAVVMTRGFKWKTSTMNRVGKVFASTAQVEVVSL